MIKMDIFNGTGVIDEITPKEGKKGAFYKLKIDNRTYNSFDSTESFKKIEAGYFPAGTEVNYEYTETTSGEYTYKNLQDIFKTGRAHFKETDSETINPFTKPTTVPPKENKTGTQIVRMNALTNAINFFNLNKEVVAMNLAELPKDKQTEGVSEITVKKLAENFETWVTR